MLDLLLALLAAPAPSAPAADGQWGGGESSEREGVIKPRMSYPVGNPEAMGRIMLGAMRDERRKEEGCRKFGCLIVVNDSASYRLQEFHVRPLAPKGDADWGPNQLDRPLRSREGIVRFKLDDQRFCNWPVRFVLRDPKTRENIPLDANANLCAAPMHNTVLRVRYVRPEVTVEQPAGPATP